MRWNRSASAAATGLAAACLGLGLPATAWAATPDVPEALRISTGPYAGFQQCGAPTPPTFSATNGSAPLFAASVKGLEPQPGLNGRMELARLGEQPFGTFRTDTGAGHVWAVQIPASTFSPGDYQWRIRAEGADGPSDWSAWCVFTVTGPEPTEPTEFTYSPDGGEHCLDVSGAGTQDATRVQLWDCNGSLGQTWRTTPEGTLVNPNSGKCLDVADGGTADGTTVQLHTCNGTGAQQWRYDRTVPLAFVHPGSGKCLDVPYANFTNGVPLQIHECNGTDAQVWKELTPA